MNSPDNNLNSLAASATLHCLTGCAIGEIVGLMIGTALGLATAATIALADRPGLPVRLHPLDTAAAQGRPHLRRGTRAWSSPQTPCPSR